MDKSPCKDCQKRLVTAEYNCHTHCEPYKVFSNSCKAIRKSRLKNIDNEQALWESSRFVRKMAESLKRRDRERGKSKGW